MPMETISETPVIDSKRQAKKVTLLDYGIPRFALVATYDYSSDLDIRTGGH